MLQGARLVFAQETESAPRLGGIEDQVNDGGGDPITARYMRQGFFTFEPKFKLLIMLERVLFRLRLLFKNNSYVLLAKNRIVLCW
jgi:hypothetical protein